MNVTVHILTAAESAVSCTARAQKNQGDVDLSKKGNLRAVKSILAQGGLADIHGSLDPSGIELLRP